MMIVIEPLFLWDGGVFLPPGGHAILTAIPIFKQGWFVMRKKKQNLNFARNMDVDVWRENKVRARVQARLEESERAFLQAHRDDTDEELMEFIRDQASALERMPHPLELPGGLYLHKRLGDWDKLALALGMKPVSAGRGKVLYRQLMEEEEELFNRERRAKRAAKHVKKELQKQAPRPNTEKG